MSIDGILSGVWSGQDVLFCYGAAVVVTVGAGLASNSRQVAAAAILMAAGWLAAVKIYYSYHGDHLCLALAAEDCVMAIVFLRMARRRVFPLPLAFLHIGLVGAQSIVDVLRLNESWMIFGANRCFEIALIYIISCAIVRMIWIRRNERGAQKDRDDEPPYAARKASSIDPWRRFERSPMTQRIAGSSALST